MTTHPFDLSSIDPSWQTCIESALQSIDTAYLAALTQSSSWLPGPEKIFSAFSLPIHHVNYVLFGESPYPRKESANGYAFWDAAVNELWSATGLSKPVNRATSLRNIIKMLLIAEGQLSNESTTQSNIARLNKNGLIKTNSELFTNLLNHGFLLLNATPVLTQDPPSKDAKAWRPFTQHIVRHLQATRPEATFILLGTIANTIDQFLSGDSASKLYAEHPYNISFITNQQVINLFKPLHILSNNLINKAIIPTQCKPSIAILP
jgi:uracil-DNA glycosylase